jgi:6-phosphofructokinase 1
VTLIANKEKKVPDAWINQAGNDVTEEMVAYLSPLVEGEVQVPMVNGIPHYLFLPKDK